LKIAILTNKARVYEVAILLPPLQPRRIAGLQHYCVVLSFSTFHHKQSSHLGSSNSPTTFAAPQNCGATSICYFNILTFYREHREHLSFYHERSE